MGALCGVNKNRDDGTVTDPKAQGIRGIKLPAEDSSESDDCGVPQGSAIQLESNSKQAIDIARFNQNIFWYYPKHYSDHPDFIGAGNFGSVMIRTNKVKNE